MQIGTIRPQVAVVVAAVAAILAVSVVSSSSEAETASNQAETTQGVTSGEALGQMPIGDPDLVPQEARCAEQVENAPWYPTIAPVEHANIQRTTLFGCATFAGSMDGPNVVEAGEPVGNNGVPFNMATRNPDEMYLYAGGSAPSLNTYISKLEPGSAKELWRTYLSDARENNQLHLSGAVDIYANGDIVAISDHTLYKLDGESGAILAKQDMPTGESEPTNSAFNGYDAFYDGTIIARSMNRPEGCTKNGYQAAASPESFGGCPGGPEAAPPSVLVAVNPDTLEVLDWIQLPDNISGRVTTTEFGGHKYAYVTGTSQIYRYEWDGNKLKQDPDWGPVTYTKEGQGQSGAAVVMGDWVILSTNGNPAEVPLSVVAISQADDSKVARFDPNPSMESGQESFYYAKPSVDPENDRIYVMDEGLGTASAIDFRDGKMSLAWQEKERSGSYITLIGPKDGRVFVATDQKPDEGVGVMERNPGPEGANYTEQIQWRDAATGKLLAASDYYSPSTAYSQVPPGYGGMIYNMLQDGRIVPLYVRPEALATNLPSSGGAAASGAYQVQPGDTLSQIAERSGSSVEAVAQANGIENPNLIFAGQLLYLPAAPDP